MAVIHGRTATGSIVPIKVAADGSLTLGSGTIEIAEASIEASFGGLPEHWNGTATDTAAEVTFSDTTRSLLVDNVGETYNLLVSFDGGTKWKTLPPEASVNIPVDANSVHVKCAAGETTDYEMIAVVAE